MRWISPGSGEGEATGLCWHSRDPGPVFSVCCPAGIIPKSSQESTVTIPSLQAGDWDTPRWSHLLKVIRLLGGGADEKLRQAGHRWPPPSFPSSTDGSTLSVLLQVCVCGWARWKFVVWEFDGVCVTFPTRMQILQGQDRSLFFPSHRWFIDGESRPFPVGLWLFIFLLGPWQYAGWDVHIGWGLWGRDASSRAQGWLGEGEAGDSNPKLMGWCPSGKCIFIEEVQVLVEAGLLCDCAVNTAVLSPWEPTQYGETLSSLLLLIEKPIAIYLLTLDIKSIPRGGAPANNQGACAPSPDPLLPWGSAVCILQGPQLPPGWGRPWGGVVMGEMFPFNFQSWQDVFFSS